MKKIIIIACLFTAVLACKQKETNKTPEKTPTIAEKIANAHGFEHWKHVSQLHFTFNVDKDSTHFERSWIWKPKTGDITLISSNDTISYNSNSLDSLSLKADKGFINDKFWLLAPFQLVWNKNASISNPVKATSEISNTELNKITLTYPNEGGYTPGDAYDFYYDDNFIIREWIFRRGNSKEATMVTSWDAYKDFNGLKISTEHRKKGENWKLYFTKIKVETN